MLSPSPRNYDPRMDSSELPLEELTIQSRDARIRRERALQLPSNLREPGNSNRCVNCGDTLNWDPLPSPSHWRWLFCTQLCQQEAKYVRYFRSTARAGRQTDPGVLRELHMKRAHILGGGYPAEERRLSQVERDLVVERDGGRCVICREPGQEIDHVAPLEAPALNAPANLQLLCQACHLIKTRRNLVPLDPDDAESAATLARLDARCRSVPPSSFVDDDQQWESWRPKLTSYRRARYLG